MKGLHLGAAILSLTGCVASAPTIPASEVFRAYEGRPVEQMLTKLGNPDEGMPVGQGWAYTWFVGTHVTQEEATYNSFGRTGVAKGTSKRTFSGCVIEAQTDSNGIVTHTRTISENAKNEIEFTLDRQSLAPGCWQFNEKAEEEV